MSALSLQLLVVYLGVLVVIFVLLAAAALSVHRIGPNQVGLVIRRWVRGRTSAGPVALRGEAGHQAHLLMPGVAFRLWPINRVDKHP